MGRAAGRPRPRAGEEPPARGGSGPDRGRARVLGARRTWNAAAALDYRDWLRGMSLPRKKGFYKQDVNRTAWELPKIYVSPTHVGSGAYGTVW